MAEPPAKKIKRILEEEREVGDDKINKDVSAQQARSQATTASISIPKSIFLSQSPQPDLTLQITNFFYSMIVENHTIKTQIENLKKKDYVLGVEIEVWRIHLAKTNAFFDIRSFLLTISVYICRLRAN